MDQSALEILCSFLSANTGAAQKGRVEPVSPREWEALLAAAQMHKVMPLLYQRLKELGAPMPPPIAEQLRLSYRDNAWRNMQVYEQFDNVVRALQAKSIPVIALKGAFLAEAIYGDLALRRMRDIDLLAREGDLPEIDGVLVQQGYRPLNPNRLTYQDNYHFHYAQPETGIAVEVHWALIPPSCRLQVDTDQLWVRARPVHWSHAATLELSPEDLVLHLCLHAAKDLYSTCSLRMLCDLDRVVQRYAPEMDWTTLGGRAHQWGIGRALYFFLRLTKNQLNTAIPDRWLDSLQPAGFDERYLALAREQIQSCRNWDQGGVLESRYLARIWHARTLGTKLALIRERLLPPRQALSFRYAAPADSWRIYLYYPMRAIDMLTKYGPVVWRLIRRDAKTKVITDHTNQIDALSDWLLSESTNAAPPAA